MDQSELMQLSETVYSLWEKMSILPEGVKEKLDILNAWKSSLSLGHAPLNHIAFISCMSLIDDYRYLFELYVRASVGETPIID